jgi:hypothetical protein
MFDDLAFEMTDFACLMGLNGGCVIYLLRALVSSSGLDSRQDIVAREEQKSRAEEPSRREERIIFTSSLTKGYLGSYKKGTMLGKRYSIAMSILN